MDQAKGLFQWVDALLDRSGEGCGQKSGCEKEAGKPPSLALRGDVRGDITVGRFRLAQYSISLETDE